MWKHTTKSVRGSAHHVNGLPCQDASGSILCGEVLICVLSDGAGSAKFSDIGSTIIVKETLGFFRDYFRDVESFEIAMRDLDLKQGEWLVDKIRESIVREAIDLNEPDEEFAGTLLAAVVSRNRAVFYQVGDGVWCACKSGVLGAVTWPEQGEFAGQTVFVTSSSASKSLQFMAIEGTVDYVIGITDGLERISLDLQGKVPHLGFWNPLMTAFRKTDSVTDFTRQVEEFLDSPRVCERTDDDKSLTLIIHEDSV